MYTIFKHIYDLFTYNDRLVRQKKNAEAIDSLIAYVEKLLEERAKEKLKMI